MHVNKLEQVQKPIHFVISVSSTILSCSALWCWKNCVLVLYYCYYYYSTVLYHSKLSFPRVQSFSCFLQSFLSIFNVYMSSYDPFLLLQCKSNRFSPIKILLQLLLCYIYYYIVCKYSTDHTGLEVHFSESTWLLPRIWQSQPKRHDYRKEQNVSNTLSASVRPTQIQRLILIFLVWSGSSSSTLFSKTTWRTRRGIGVGGHRGVKRKKEKRKVSKAVEKVWLTLRISRVWKGQPQREYYWK